MRRDAGDGRLRRRIDALDRRIVVLLGVRRGLDRENELSRSQVVQRAVKARLLKTIVTAALAAQSNRCDAVERLPPTRKPEMKSPVPQFRQRPRLAQRPSVKFSVCWPRTPLFGANHASGGGAFTAARAFLDSEHPSAGNFSHSAASMRFGKSCISVSNPRIASSRIVLTSSGSPAAAKRSQDACGIASVRWRIPTSKNAACVWANLFLDQFAAGLWQDISYGNSLTGASGCAESDNRGPAHAILVSIGGRRLPVSAPAV